MRDMRAFLGLTLLLASAAGSTCFATEPPRIGFAEMPPETATPASAAAGLATQPNRPEGRWWLRAEYLAWWTNGARTPVLVSGSPPGTPVSQGGVLGTPGAVILFGGDRINDDVRHGYRLRAGRWLDCDGSCAIEAGFFQLGSPVGNSFTAACGSGGAIVGRPFIDATNGSPDAELVCAPGVLSGSVSIEAPSELLGADVVFRRRLCCIRSCDQPGACSNGYRRLDVLAGYRFLSFRDQLTVTERLAPETPDIIPGTRILVEDDFRSSNLFHGGVIGLAGEWSRGRFSIAGETRLNLGATEREVSIQGFTAVSVPGDVTAVNRGGLLALPSNIGTQRSTEFTAIPEFDLRLGCRITPRIRASVGYTLIIWPNVSRAGEQIDPVVNPFLLPPPLPNPPGPPRPAFLDDTSTLLVHGLSVGLEFRW